MIASIGGAVSGLFFLGLAGAVMGHIARYQIRRFGRRGNGMALVALWLGYTGGLLWAVFIVACFVSPSAVAAASASSSASWVVDAFASGAARPL